MDIRFKKQPVWANVFGKGKDKRVKYSTVVGNGKDRKKKKSMFITVAGSRDTLSDFPKTEGMFRVTGKGFLTCDGWTTKDGDDVVVPVVLLQEAEVVADKKKKKSYDDDDYDDDDDDEFPL